MPPGNRHGSKRFKNAAHPKAAAAPEAEAVAAAEAAEAVAEAQAAEGAAEALASRQKRLKFEAFGADEALAAEATAEEGVFSESQVYTFCVRFPNLIGLLEIREKSKNQDLTCHLP